MAEDEGFRISPVVGALVFVGYAALISCGGRGDTSGGSSSSTSSASSSTSNSSASSTSSSSTSSSSSSSSSTTSSSSASGGLNGYHPDIVSIADIPLSAIEQAPGPGWQDSYSVGDRCYCDSTFDHNIGNIMVQTPYGPMTVLQVCEWVGAGPGAQGRPVYNDIQCGNGPANDAGDEDWCPGRVDLGKPGCVQIGPTWKFD